jgi:hypothetical protein
VSLIELLAATAIFLLLFLMIDGVFITAHRGARTVESAAESGQNARIAIDRLTREIRETRATEVVTGGSPDAGAVVFKSARYSDSVAAFCLDVAGSGDSLYDANCWTAPGPVASPGGTYLPVWQRYVGSYVTGPAGGPYRLHRYTGNLSQSGEALPGDPSIPPGDAEVAVIATGLEIFDVEPLAGNRFTVRIAARSAEPAQGSPVPPQQIQLDATVLLQN